MEKKQTVLTESAHEEHATWSHDEIAKIAYALWEERGGGHGFAEQDWLEAEQRLQGKPSQDRLAFQTKSQAA
jgi:hypothetical protein